MIAPSELSFVADEITAHLGYVDVVAARDCAPLPWACADVLARQDAGEDATREWRARVGANQERYYRAPAPPSVGAAFVLQWYLGVVANPLAFAAHLGPWVLDGAPEALTFDLAEPEMFPSVVRIDGAGASIDEDPVRRLASARDRYLAHARRFEAGYRPEVKFGSRQRGGMIEDAWTMACESARAATSSDRVERARRISCCFIFALPGAHECAVCPRAARSGDPRRSPAN